jgi:starch phosphorylase
MNLQPSVLGPFSGNDSSPASDAQPHHDSVFAELQRCLLYSVGKDAAQATQRDWFIATTTMVRQLLATQWARSRQQQERWQNKRVYYLSMEFLLGRLLTDALRNLGLYDSCRAALARAGCDLEEMASQETDPALGNGGLGRLAACLMDSLASLGIPAYGYGIRFEYGLFSQEIENGWQIEKPENWLRHGNPWEFAREDVTYAVPFHGTAAPADGAGGEGTPLWTGTEDVLATAYDMPICGFRSTCVNTLRLWSAKASDAFCTQTFNDGDHLRALEQRTQSENISRVLYPGDSTEAGRELRFRQEFFFVSASIQDILADYTAAHEGFDALPDKVAIQINDTHPSMAVAELVRLLIDRYGVGWDKAWDLTRRTIAYTNHTLMPEALETWPVSYFERILPRHLQIIYRINAAFLESVDQAQPADQALIERLSLVDESGERRVRMAHLAFVGSHKVNGVSQMHSDLMKQTVFGDFAALLPDRIVNVTNGVTPRRWLVSANPMLSELISRHIGTNWLGNLDELRRLAGMADDAAFQDEFLAIKQRNKDRFASHVMQRCDTELHPQALLDVHVKRIHEYKRQLLKLLHAITLYNRIGAGQGVAGVPRTILFAGKAAPGYAMAKLIVKLIHDVAAVVNADPRVGDRLRLVFLPGYSVSEAQIIIPAADLSEQISTAGTEASGTGNMKLALNGALTIGTLDGANIEIAEAVGRENFFDFGHTVEEVAALRAGGYDPRTFYEADAELRLAIDMIADGAFAPDEPDLFRPITEGLLGSDHFMVLADYRSYLDCQDRVEAVYADRRTWARRAILNVANMGCMSSDRAVAEYAAKIWHRNPGETEDASAPASAS